MSEQGNDQAGGSISVADINRFFEATGVPAGCPSCNRSALTFNIEDGKSYAFLGPDRKNPDIIGANIAWLVLLYCRNCGYVQPHLRTIVEKWLENNRE